MNISPDRPLRLAFGRVPRLRADVVVLSAVVALIAWAALVPLGYLLARALVVDGRFTLAPLRRAFADQDLLPLVGNSLAFAAGATLLAVTAGTVLAYLVERTDLPFRRTILVVSLVPLIVPGILYTISWIFLAAPRTGALNTLLEPVLGPGTFDVFGLGGMILVEGLHLAPVVLLVMVAAFRSLDPALEESARMSSASELTVFRRVSLPLVRPALAIAVLLVLVRALEAFEVPALLGLPGNTWVLTSRIWRALSFYPADYGTASSFALLLLTFMTLGVYLHTRLSRRGRRFQTVTGKGFRPAPVRLRRWRWPVTTMVGAYLLVAVVLPLLLLVYVSTQPFYAAPSLARLGQASLGNYADVLTDAASLRAARNSVLLAVAAASAVAILGAVAAWLVVRTRIRGRWLVGGLALIPLVMPGLVLGQAILFAYLRLPVPVYGTLWILLIAYVTRFLPYGLASATASMYQVGSELEESARTSGASWWPTFRRVVLPLVAPGLLAGWLAVVIFSLRELSSSILLYSPGDEVLAVRLWEEFQNGRFGEVSALGVLMVVGLLPLVGAAYALGSRVGISRYRG
jgi:iron(III) transport system permease protein